MSTTDFEYVFVALVIQHEDAYANEEIFVRIFELYLAVLVTIMYSKMCLYLLDLLALYTFFSCFPCVQTEELRIFLGHGWLNAKSLNAIWNAECYK